MGFWDKLLRAKNSGYSESDAHAMSSVEEITGYHFRNLDILLLALTHRSFFRPNEKHSSRQSNERLEFLGDSVLGLVIADLLYQDHPDLREGEMTKLKAMLVNEITLSMIGKSIGLNKYIRLSPEEDKLGGRERPSIISDAFESILGAIYIDGGFGAATDVITRTIYLRKEEISNDKSQTNFKGDLLEMTQAKGEGMPFYEVISESGPDHDKEFKVAVLINSKKIGTGVGHTKKEAEQKAAAMALEALKK